MPSVALATSSAVFVGFTIAMRIVKRRQGLSRHWQGRLSGSSIRKTTLWRSSGVGDEQQECIRCHYVALEIESEEPEERTASHTRCGGRCDRGSSPH